MTTFLLPLKRTIALTKLLLINLNYTPVCPDVVRTAPNHFNTSESRTVVKIRVTDTCVNGYLVPPLFNIVTGRAAVTVFPCCLLIVLVLVKCVRRTLRGGAGTTRWGATTLTFKRVRGDDNVFYVRVGPTPTPRRSTNLAVKYNTPQF